MMQLSTIYKKFWNIKKYQTCYSCCWSALAFSFYFGFLTFSQNAEIWFQPYQTTPSQTFFSFIPPSCASLIYASRLHLSEREDEEEEEETGISIISTPLLYSFASTFLFILFMVVIIPPETQSLREVEFSEKLTTTQCCTLQLSSGTHFKYNIIIIIIRL